MALEFSAPAKVNLYLHIIDRLDNGYHTLDSLTVFCPDICDALTLTPADTTSFTLTGAFAAPLSQLMNDDNNLILQAISGLSQRYGIDEIFGVTLNKALPIAAGIGGGSSDAAAVVRALVTRWKISEDAALHDFLLSLGADVPACYRSRALFMRGIGDHISAAPDLPPLYAVLVNPNQPCPTPPIFKKLDLSQCSGAIDAPEASFRDTDALLTLLRSAQNDLQSYATHSVPAIETVLRAIEGTADCEIARMSGSGATCFGLYKDMETAKAAYASISRSHPDWWTAYGKLA